VQQTGRAMNARRKCTSSSAGSARNSSRTSDRICYTRLENPRHTSTTIALQDPARFRTALALRDLTPPLRRFPYGVSPRYKGGSESPNSVSYSGTLSRATYGGR
jgi:hypothetical protein